MTFLTTQQKRELLRRGIDGEIKLFELMHFNKDYPENWNVELRDLSRDKIAVVCGNNNGKKIYNFITKEKLTRNHQDCIHTIFRLDMCDQGIGNVPQKDIDILLELATPPSSDHRQQTCDGIVEVLQKYKNIIPS